VLIGATTENPFFSLTGPLLSRSTLFRLDALDASDLVLLMRRALEDRDRGLGKEPAEIDDDALDHLADRSEGDARHALTCLELAHALSIERAHAAEAAGEPHETPPRITLADAEAALAMRALRYGDDDHYDVVSAFIKSIRGSDPDAGLYWLARMLEAGEDARFIARRLVILASEDVGMADPTALLVADAAARAVELVGLPEAGINLAHAVIHLALAPKSNSVITALGAALETVRRLPAGAVPAHLRDAHYPGAKTLGHGEGYQYPHDAESGWVDQEHIPREVAGTSFYQPGRHGAEAELVKRWHERQTVDGDRADEEVPDADG
jgi:putative ATPase